MNAQGIKPGCECGADAHDGPHEVALADAPHVEPCRKLRGLAREFGKAIPCICEAEPPAVSFYSNLGFGPAVSLDAIRSASSKIGADAGKPIRFTGYEIDPAWLAERFGAAEDPS